MGTARGFYRGIWNPAALCRVYFGVMDFDCSGRAGGSSQRSEHDRPPGSVPAGQACLCDPWAGAALNGSKFSGVRVDAGSGDGSC